MPVGPATLTNRLVGIVTGTDLIGRVIAGGMSTDLPVSDIMNLRPITIGPQETVFDAAISMMEKNIKNLPIVKDEKVIGLLSLHQLFQNQRIQAVYLIDKIKKATSELELAEYMPERDRIFLKLANDKVPAVYHRPLSL